MTPLKYDALKRAMIEALVADPDDTGTHSAFADLMVEHGDPADVARGEFIAVQLALEDTSRSPEERKRLAAREKELLEAHQREWLGELAPFLIDGEVRGYEAAHCGHTQFPVFNTTRPAYLPVASSYESASAKPSSSQSGDVRVDSTASTRTLRSRRRVMYGYLQ